jgi:outer membrane protein assembly factor BamA
MYLANNKWFLQGDWRLLLFSQPTYGLGINNSGANEYLLQLNELTLNTPPLAEPMRFNYFRFYEDVVRQVGDKSWYVGMGIVIDYHSAIKDEKLNTDTSSQDYYITNHYAYSVGKGFDTLKYITQGFNLDVLVDKRDNIANPYKGYFASLSIRFNPKISRSTQQSVMASYDLRYYLGLDKNRPRHILAFWSYGTFVMSGNVPYLALPSIGWDTYNRSGRGYIQGRYRGVDMVYMEAEYRFPISSNGLFGGVAFVNNTFAKGIDYDVETQKFSEQKLFSKGAPAAGVGFRMKMDKRARVNLTVDYGMGLDKSSGIYFSMQEAF